MKAIKVESCIECPLLGDCKKACNMDENYIPPSDCPLEDYVSRNEILEEAARCCEERAVNIVEENKAKYGGKSERHLSSRYTCEQNAKAIRAMKEE